MMKFHQKLDWKSNLHRVGYVYQKCMYVDPLHEYLGHSIMLTIASHT